MLLHISGVSEEEVRVGLQVYGSFVGEEVAITLEEVCGCEALARVLHLRVAECEPYLLHLVFAEEAVDYLYVGA